MKASQITLTDRQGRKTGLSRVKASSLRGQSEPSPNKVIIDGVEVTLQPVYGKGQFKPSTIKAAVHRVFLASQKALLEG